MDGEGWHGSKRTRAHRISQPNLHYNSGRGESQVGLVYDKSCSFYSGIGRKTNQTIQLCKEYTSYYRKLATETVQAQQEELQEH